MLNSAEHEILNAHKYRKFKKFSSDKFFMLKNIEMPTIVGILTFMSRKKFVPSRVEHEKSFITSGPDLSLHWLLRPIGHNTWNF